MIKEISGGVCAATGFTAVGLRCGIKPDSRPDRKDLALIYSEQPCSAAGMYTTNQVKASCVQLTMQHLADGHAQAVVANSCNANACAPEGMENARRMGKAAADLLGLQPEDMVICSTGVIGQRLNIEAIEKGLPEAAKALSRTGSDDAAHAIMTTDTIKKEYAFEAEIGGKTVHLGGISKGSGMIHPNMGTMLCFLTTDCAIQPALLDQALREAVRVSFHRISVDGDTSTNDTCVILANGMAGNAELTEPGADYEIFLQMLTKLCVKLARDMAADGEGAKHLITCVTRGAASEQQAEVIAKSIISSTLTKAAIFGCDANWGRVLCAMGYSGEKFNPEQVDVSFASTAGTVAVCKNGRGLNFDEDLAKKVLTEPEVVIDVTMHEGSGEATCWGCDLTYDYVRINGDYRT